MPVHAASIPVHLGLLRRIGGSGRGFETHYFKFYKHAERTLECS